MNLSNIFDKPWWRVVKWIIVLVAYGYLAYKLATYDNYAALWEIARTSKLQRIGLIVAALALLPLNVFLEAAKWKFLNRNIETMTLIEAQRQVYFGFIGAFLTPYRLGDFPSRAISLRDKSKWDQATIMGFIGGGALTLVIVIIGLFPAVYYFNNTPAWWQIIAAIIGCLALGLGAPKFLLRQSEQSNKESMITFLGAIGWSFLRYVIFSLQLYCVLLYVGAEMSLQEAIAAIPFYYLLVTITPNMPIADVGIRGSWAIAVFSKYGEVPLLTAAIIIVYTINTLLPTLIGLIIAGLTHKS